MGIRSIQQQQSVGSHMEVLLNFIEYLKSVAPGLTKEVTLVADSYLMGEKHLGQQKRFQPYDLPAHEPLEQAEEIQEPPQRAEQLADAQQPPAAQLAATSFASTRRTHTFTAPQPPRSPLLHPVTPQTVVWPPVKKKEKPKPGIKIPPHLKGEERQIWINYIEMRDKLLGPDTDNESDKV
ncbi:MAG: hypothetical protein ACTHJ0_05600 [Flavipsychrobacter sp.]